MIADLPCSKGWLADPEFLTILATSIHDLHPTNVRGKERLAIGRRILNCCCTRLFGRSLSLSICLTYFLYYIQVRCDAASLGVPCTNCVAFSIECKIPTPKRKKHQGKLFKDGIRYVTSVRNGYISLEW